MLKSSTDTDEETPVTAVPPSLLLVPIYICKFLLHKILNYIFIPIIFSLCTAHLSEPLPSTILNANRTKKILISSTYTHAYRRGREGLGPGEGRDRLLTGQFGCAPFVCLLLALLRCSHGRQIARRGLRGCQGIRNGLRCKGWAAGGGSGAIRVGNWYTRHNRFAANWCMAEAIATKVPLVRLVQNGCPLSNKPDKLHH